MNSGALEKISLYIYDSEGGKAWDDYTYSAYWNSVTGKLSYENSVPLTSGTYYLVITSSYTGSYTIEIDSFTSSGETFKETTGGNNNTYQAADSVSLYKTYKGQIAENDEEDWYQFTLSSDMVITVSGSVKYDTVGFSIQSVTTSGASAKVSWSAGVDSATKTGTYSKSCSLSEGTYYLVCENYYGRIGEYSFKIQNTLDDAELSYARCTYNGSSRKPSVTVTNAAGKVLTKNTDYTVSYSDNKNVGTATVTITGKGNYAGTITKNFTIVSKSISSASVTLSKTKYTYDGDEHSPSATVKIKLSSGKKKLKKNTDYTVTYYSNTSIGTATVKITGTGNYTGSVEKTFKIVPKQVKLKSSTKSTKAKTLTVKWSKVSGDVSYKVAYQKKGSSKWHYTYVSAGTYKTTISNLKSGSTYYVKVKAYKKVGSKTYAGSWSETKTVKVK